MRKTSVLLCVLVSLASIATVHGWWFLPETKLPDVLALPTDDAESGLKDGIIEPEVPPVLLWEKCRVLKKLGKVCIGIYENLTDTPSSAGLEFRFAGRVIYAPIVHGKACLGDAALLAALAHDPQFAPLAKEIHALMIIEQMAGAEIISECVSFSKTVLTRKYLKTCVDLHSQLACFHDRCAVHADDSFGCFTIQLPHRVEEPEALLGTFSTSF